MRNYAALGLIFANMYDDALRECTATAPRARCLSAARYRLIDFVLSNMVNAGISKVA